MARKSTDSHSLTLWERLKTSAASAGICFGFAFGFLALLDYCSLSNEDGAQETRPRAVDLADIDSADGRTRQSLLRESERADLEAVLRERRSLRRMFLDGQEQWLHTLVHLDDPGFAADQRLRCSSVYGKNISTCLYRVSMVFRPLGDDRAEIIYAESDLIDPADSPGLARVNHPDCPSFTQCVAGIRIGEVVPIPGDEEHVFALEQLYQSNQAHPMNFRVEKVRQSIDALDGAIVRWTRNKNRTAKEEWKLRKAQNLSHYLRGHVRKLREIE